MLTYHVVLSLIFYANAHIVPKDNNNIVSVNECLQEIINTYVDFKDHLAIFNEDTKLDKVFNTGHTKVIYNLKTLQFKLEKAKGYLIILKNSKIGEIFKYFSLLSNWNPRAKFIVMSNIENKESIISQAIKYLVVDLLVLETNQDAILFYSWDPYEALCQKYLNVTYLDTCQNGVFAKQVTLFDKTLTNAWNGCTLRVLPMLLTPYVFKDRNKEIDGLEIRTLDAIKAQMGFEINYLQHNFKTWGLRQTNGRYSDMFNMLQSYDADIVLGMWPTNYTHMWDFDVSISYLQDALVWLVPKAELQPYWMRLTIIFPKSVWISVAILIVAYPILWKIVAQLLKTERRHFRDIEKCLLDSVSVFLNLSIDIFPSTSSLRVLFILWVGVSLILVTIYQSKLIAILTQPQYELQISNVDELLASKLGFGGNINIKTLFNNTLSSNERELYNNYIVCDLTLSCPNRTAFQRDFATAKSEIPAKFLILQYFTHQDGAPMIHIFKSKIMFHYVNIVFANGHPMFKRFNLLLRRIFQSGLLKKWLNDIREDKIKHFRYDSSKAGGLSALSLENMVAPFVIIGLGLGFSVAVFISEILYAKMGKCATRIKTKGNKNLVLKNDKQLVKSKIRFNRK